MLKKLPAVLLHLMMLALVCALGAYWVLKIITPAPSASPPPVAAAIPREADPMLAARMFGLVQAGPIVASNVQLLGVFAAGKDSSAILAVDGKPARVVLLGQVVSPGSKLAEVRRDGVTLDSNGVSQDLKLPLRPPVTMGGRPAPAGFTQEGNMLAAPAAATGSAPPPTPVPGFAASGRPTPGAPMRPPPPPQPQPEPVVPPQPAGVTGQPTQ